MRNLLPATRGANFRLEIFCPQREEQISDEKFSARDARNYFSVEYFINLLKTYKKYE